MSHQIVLRKNAEKYFEEKVKIQLEQLIEATITSQRLRRGWFHLMSKPTVKKDHILVNLIIDRKEGEAGISDIAIDNEFESILLALQRACESTKPANNQWKIISVDDKKFEEIQPNENREIGYAPVAIPANYMEYFSHIYGLDDQIDIIMSRIQAAIDSEWNNRFHCTLVGEPASGKSETARAVKKMLGEDAVLEYDATATTMAGAIKDLDERDILPRILVVEEIEKTDDQSFRWLLGVMDTRAEIRKVNFKVNIQKSTKLLAIVTVNNYSMFQNKMEGALASRGGEAIYFDRPGRDRLAMILKREIDKLGNGRHEWVEPALDYAEAVGITDPRSIIPICLAGKDALLDGSYQKKLASTLIPSKRKAYYDALDKKLKQLKAQVPQA